MEGGPRQPPELGFAGRRTGEPYATLRAMPGAILTARDMAPVTSGTVCGSADLLTTPVIACVVGSPA